MSEGQQKRAFIISPISGNEKLDRRHFDQVQRFLIKPVCEENGYTCERADQLNRPGMITDHILDCIMEYELVIADLSILNPNVFYELAIRHATNLPVLLLAHKDTKIPFDVRQERAVFYSLDLDDLEQSKKQLDLLIKTVDSPDYENESPLKAKIQIESTKSVSSQEFMEKTYEIIEEVRNSIRHPNTGTNIRRYVRTKLPAITVQESKANKAERLIHGSAFNPLSQIHIYYGEISPENEIASPRVNRNGNWWEMVNLEGRKDEWHTLIVVDYEAEFEGRTTFYL